MKLDGKYEVEVEGRFLCLPVILEDNLELEGNKELEGRLEVDVIIVADEVNTLLSSFNECSKQLEKRTWSELICSQEPCCVTTDV